MSKTLLDGLIATGRLDAFCRVRREGWDEWKWAEEVYPEIASAGGAEAEAPSAGEAFGTDSALSPCPDCGQMISKRASQCPHCGCPVAVVADQGDAAEAAWQPGAEASLDRRLQPVGKMGSVAEIAGAPKGRKRKWIVLSVAGATLTVVLIVVVALALKGPRRPTGPPKELPQAQTAPAEGEAVTPETRQQWIEEASAAMAKEVDDAYRQTHLAMSLLDRASENIDLIRSLTEVSPAGDQRSEPTPPPAPDAEPYESKYDALHKECMADVRSNVSLDESDRAEIQEAARRWADRKLAPLEQKLGDELGKQLGL